MAVEDTHTTLKDEAPTTAKSDLGGGSIPSTAERPLSIEQLQDNQRELFRTLRKDDGQSVEHFTPEQVQWINTGFPGQGANYYWYNFDISANTMLPEAGYVRFYACNARILTIAIREGGRVAVGWSVTQYRPGQNIAESESSPEGERGMCVTLSQIRKRLSRKKTR